MCCDKHQQRQEINLDTFFNQETKKHKMKRNQSSSSSSTKVDRKIVEKNRRDQMKILYNQLYSLLPQNQSKEDLSLPDQIDAAMGYIQTLETNIKKAKEEKDRLQSRKRLHYCTTESTERLKSAKLDIHEIGSSLELVLITGLDHKFMFQEIISILYQEGVEVTNANYSVVGDTIFHLIYVQIAESMFDVGGRKNVIERLKKLVYGSRTEEEGQLEICPEVCN